MLKWEILSVGGSQKYVPITPAQSSLAQVNQVQPRRWKVDANSRQDAVLMLSSVNLPGGVQVGSSVYRRSQQSNDIPTAPQVGKR